MEKIPALLAPDGNLCAYHSGNEHWKIKTRFKEGAWKRLLYLGKAAGKLLPFSVRRAGKFSYFHWSQKPAEVNKTVESWLRIRECEADLNQGFT
ncbi:unnamed protein product [Thelazia callipaeda]|uniref:Transposase n=1 Tax=Thelazia callipaeda TaxID=103827 RepID=A0A0N5CTL3_THECL|nr:unnamed protein product [Thelazia callipaeda]